MDDQDISLSSQPIPRGMPVECGRGGGTRSALFGVCGTDLTSTSSVAKTFGRKDRRPECASTCPVERGDRPSGPTGAQSDANVGMVRSNNAEMEIHLRCTFAVFELTGFAGDDWGIWVGGWTGGMGMAGVILYADEGARQIAQSRGRGRTSRVAGAIWGGGGGGGGWGRGLTGG